MAFSPVVLSGAFSLVVVQGLLIVVASLVAEHGLLSLQASEALGLSSCGTQAYLHCSMWNLPRLGIEPVSPAMAGGFLTIGLPGTPQTFLIFLWIGFFVLWGFLEMKVSFLCE